MNDKDALFERMRTLLVLTTNKAPDHVWAQNRDALLRDINKYTNRGFDPNEMPVVAVTQKSKSLPGENAIDPDSWKGRELERKYPGRGPFTGHYFSGSYYDRAQTNYHDKDCTYLETEDHGHYG